MENKTVRNMTIRNLPNDLLDDVKERAAKNLRSMNNEIIAILKQAIEKEGK